MTAPAVTAHDLLDDTRRLLDPRHVNAVADLLARGGWRHSDALEAAKDVLAASYLIAADNDEDD